jgi:hypothetical protein
MKLIREHRGLGMGKENLNENLKDLEMTIERRLAYSGKSFP